MIVLLDTSESLDVAQQELGCSVEQLLTPLTRFRRQHPAARFAVDNGAFAGFDANSFMSLLEREKDALPLCRFVTVPDVVGDARRTAETFKHWYPRIHTWPVALVAQDGIENVDIPWNILAAIFIGGTTDFKLGPKARSVIAAAKVIGKWVHVGRVNTPGRFEYFEELGADSIDGTGLSRYSWMRRAIYEQARAPKLSFGQDSASDEHGGNSQDSRDDGPTGPMGAGVSLSKDAGRIKEVEALPIRRQEFDMTLAALADKRGG